jgi:hypothetical protein
MFGPVYSVPGKTGWISESAAASVPKCWAPKNAWMNTRDNKIKINGKGGTGIS